MDYADVQLDWDALRLALKDAREKRATGKMAIRTLAKKAGVDASTISRIEGVEKYPDHTPDLETLSALVDGLGLTMTEFFAQVEGVAETSEDEREFLKLPKNVRLLAIGMASGLDRSLLEHQRATQPDESSRGTTRGVRTKSEPDRHRPPGPRKTGT